MKNLRDYIKEAESKKVAIGHFNVSDLVALKAIFEAGQKLNLPIIIGVSEGERDFIGVRQIAALVKSLREESGHPIFLNADHSHSLERVKEAVKAGFDAAVFDASRLSLEENIRKTKEVVEYVKSINPDFIIEGELGYIGAGSIILKEIPGDIAFGPENLTKTEEAARFIKETGVDLLAPALGNIHGMFANMPNPDLDIPRIAEIKKAVQIPLVLHGGSGIKDSDFISAIDAGISVIHINTELRLAWRRGLEAALKEKPEEIVPYKLLAGVLGEVEKSAEKRLELFAKIL